MAKTTAIIRSNTLSVFMYVMMLTCVFGSLDEVMVSYLTRLTLSGIDNASYLSLSVVNSVCVNDVIRK